MREYHIIDIPDDTWLSRLRRENIVALAKEKCFASVEWEYEDPGPSHICGQIGIRLLRQDYDGWRYGEIQKWFINANGTGINGTQCLLPVMGHVPSEPRELKSDDMRYFTREMNAMQEQIRRLQNRVFFLENGRHPFRTAPIDTVAVEKEETATSPQVVGVLLVSGKSDPSKRN